MAISLSSPVSGGTVSGFTSPTYTVTADTPPSDSPNGKQWAVTALGGTQAGVNSHSVAAPFTITFTKPKVMRQLGTPNPTTGVVKAVPRNVYTILVRKGVLPLSGQPYATMIVRTTVEVPAGSDVADAPNVKAAISLMCGTLANYSSGLADTALSAIL